MLKTKNHNCKKEGLKILVKSNIKAERFKYLALVLVWMAISACNQNNQSISEVGEQGKVIVRMIESVNQKDPDKYVEGFADRVQVFVFSQLKIEGKENLKKNRAQHFKVHPNLRSEIQHIVEIDNKVILHDKVWLTDQDHKGKDIVEIFTFKDGIITRVDVIQPENLFQNND